MTTLGAVHVLKLGIINLASVNKTNQHERMLMAAIKHNTSNSCYANALLHFIIIFLGCYYMDNMDVFRLCSHYFCMKTST